MNENFEVIDKRFNFTQIDNEVITEYGLDPYEITVYLHLAMMSNNKTKRCYPGLGYLKDKIGISRDKVFRSINKLVELGLIEKEHKKTSKGVRNEYILLSVRKTSTSGRLGSSAEKTRVVRQEDSNNINNNNTKLTINLPEKSGGNKQKSNWRKTDPTLHSDISKFFQSKSSSTYKDFKLQGRAINNIIDRAKLYKPEFKERDMLTRVINKYYDLYKVDKFLQKNPFLPSSLNSNYTWLQVIEAIEAPQKQASDTQDILDAVNEKFEKTGGLI